MDAITVVERFKGLPDYFSKPCFFHNLDKKIAQI